VNVWRLGEEIRLTGVAADEGGVRFDVATPRERLDGLRTPMLGAHQAANGALAAAAALWLTDRAPVSEAAIRAGLARARIAGRLELLRRDPVLLIDGAHNPDAARRLRETLQALFRAPGPSPGTRAAGEGSPRRRRVCARVPAQRVMGFQRRLILVLGALSTHPYAQVVDELAPAVDRVIATRPPHPQAVPAAELAERARALGTPAEVVEPVAAAVERALTEARPEDVICVAGSFYTIAEVSRDRVVNK
jgi:dihydrofolate synthase/folylpolyglutamate synthase